MKVRSPSIPRQWRKQICERLIAPTQRQWRKQIGKPEELATHNSSYKGNASNTNPQIKPVKVRRLQKREDTRQPPMVSQKHREHQKRGLPSPHYQPNARANSPRLAQPQQPLQVHRNPDKDLKAGCEARGPSISPILGIFRSKICPPLPSFGCAQRPQIRVQSNSQVEQKPPGTTISWGSPKQFSERKNSTILVTLMEERCQVFLPHERASPEGLLSPAPRGEMMPPNHTTLSEGKSEAREEGCSLACSSPNLHTSLSYTP